MTRMSCITLRRKVLTLLYPYENTNTDAEDAILPAGLAPAEDASAEMGAGGGEGGLSRSGGGGKSTKSGEKRDKDKEPKTPGGDAKIKSVSIKIKTPSSTSDDKLSSLHSGVFKVITTATYILLLLPLLLLPSLHL